MYRATAASIERGANGVIGIEDVLFLMRKNPIKVQRFFKYFKAKDLSSQVVISQQGGHSFITDTNKRARRCRWEDFSRISNYSITPTRLVGGPYGPLLTRSGFLVKDAFF